MDYFNTIYILEKIAQDKKRMVKRATGAAKTVPKTNPLIRPFLVNLKKILVNEHNMSPKEAKNHIDIIHKNLKDSGVLKKLDLGMNSTVKEFFQKLIKNPNEALLEYMPPSIKDIFVKGETVNLPTVEPILEPIKNIATQTSSGIKNTLKTFATLTGGGILGAGGKAIYDNLKKPVNTVIDTVKSVPWYVQAPLYGIPAYIAYDYLTNSKEDDKVKEKDNSENN